MMKPFSKEFEIKQAVSEIHTNTDALVTRDDLTSFVYSSDASMIRAKPCGVIHIKKITDISKVIEILFKYSIPFTPRCAGTNLTGGATNQKGGFIINLSPCNRIHQIDTEKKLAVVEPGVVNLHLQMELEKFGYFYPPDPASQKVSTIGGNIAENSGGPRCIKYGVTLNNIYAVEVVLPDGNEIYLSVDDSGPEILNIFAGSEGTLGIIKKAWLKILPKPIFKSAVYAEFASLEDTMKSVEEIISSGVIPSALEALDRVTALLTSKNSIDDRTEGILIIEIDNFDKEQLASERNNIEKIISRTALKIKYSDKEDEIEELFRIRKEAYPSLAKIANNIVVEDGCVPRSNLTKAVKEIQEILNKNSVQASLVFHAGDGNIHPNIIFDERDIKHTNKIRKIAHQILEIYLKYDGTVSAEHGVGVEKRGYVAIQHTKEVIDILNEIKKAIDPKNISNPNKKIPLSTDVPKKIKKKEYEIPFHVKEIINEISDRYIKKISSVIKGSSSHLKDEYNLKEISSKNLKNIIDFDRRNMILIAESGITINALNTILMDEGFMTIDEEGTLGGFVSRGNYIEIRDIITSMDIILSDGRFLHLGSKNIKDTTVYEIMRMLIGSRGTLAFITSIGLKLFKGTGSIKLTPKKLFKNITPLHIKIKNVFDHQNLFNPFLTREMYEK